MDNIDKETKRIAKITGSSPSEDRYYILVVFDITQSKKYRSLFKVLNGYLNRFQYSVFEGYLKNSKIKEVVEKVERVMNDKNYLTPTDKVRIYKISSVTEVIIFGDSNDITPQKDVFL